MLETESLAGSCEVLGDVARAVVGHDARNRNAEAGVIGNCRIEEGYGTDGLFVREDVGEGDAGCIVDRDMDVFPADAA